MRLVPHSLAGRLMVLSVVTTLVALTIAAVGIGHVLERFVMRGMDQQLDAQVTMLARAVRSDGTLDRSRVVDLPVFADAGSGWGWRVESAKGVWSAGDALDTSPHIGPPPLPAPAGRPLAAPAGLPPVAPGEARASDGERVHTRELRIPTRAGDVAVIAGAPRRLVTEPLREAMVPLLGSLALLGVLLAAAALIQLRYGLRPLNALQHALAEVRAGRARHVPADQPRELAPLAAELNALVDQNEAQLAHARRHVANLAHGLKTPLAALAVKLEDSGADTRGDLRAVVADIDARVRHHLGRARAAAPGGGQRVRTPVETAVAGLITAMRGIHADRPIAAKIDLPDDLAVAADAQDVDEMLGNLLDNAWRHARTSVTVTGERVGTVVRVIIDDDGPGLSEQAIREALVPGRRLDERGDGHGFGLPIAQELAELNGGNLSLGTAPISGLRVTLTLPAATCPG